MAKHQQRPREWPDRAGAVADNAVDALGVIAMQAASIHGQALAIGGIALGCVTEIGEGNVEDVRHMLLSIRELTAAQQLLCVSIKDGAMTQRAALAGARRGEY